MSHEPHLTLAGNSCEVHKYHWPRPLRTVKHHIWPQEYGGPTVPTNLVLVCDTGHYNIHAVLDALLKGTTPPKTHKAEQSLALAGYAAIKKAAPHA